MNKLRLLAGILFWGAGMTCLPTVYGADNPQSRQRGNSGQHRTTQSKTTTTRSTANRRSSVTPAVQNRPNNKGTRPGGGKGHGNNHGGYGSGHGDNHGGYGSGHGNNHGGYGNGHGNNHGGYGSGHGNNHGGYGNGHGNNHGGYGSGHGDNHGGYGSGHGNNHGNHYYGNSVPAPGGHPYPGGYRPPMRPRWERPLPPPPPRYNYVRVGVPPIQAILGLTFGSLIDAGINSLINAGYTVSSAINNAIFLNNVSQFGIIWPEATIYYGGAGMSGVRFQYGSYSPTDYRYRTVYAQLCSMYGNPISTTFTNGNPSCTWWGGNNTGYITLTYGPALNQSGATMYYTDLIYGI